jgi:hypothetical protein
VWNHTHCQILRTKSVKIKGHNLVGFLLPSELHWGENILVKCFTLPKDNHRPWV